MIKNRVLSHVLPILAARFEQPGDNRLNYHDSIHTVGVVEAGIRIAEAMYLGNEERDAVTVGCAFHDIEQFWEELSRPDGSIMRRRQVGKSEASSGKDAVSWMVRQAGFSREIQTLAHDGIIATIPVWSDELGTVVQNIDWRTHPVVRAIAMADLAICGTDPAAFVVESGNLFFETELDISRAMCLGKSIFDESQKWYLERYVRWIQSQVGFVRGRKIRFEEDIAGLPLAIQRNLRALFCRFDDVIDAAEYNAILAGKLTFEEFKRLYQ